MIHVVAMHVEAAASAVKEGHLGSLAADVAEHGVLGLPAHNLSWLALSYCTQYLFVTLYHCTSADMPMGTMTITLHCPSPSH